MIFQRHHDGADRKGRHHGGCRGLRATPRTNPSQQDGPIRTARVGQTLTSSPLLDQGSGPRRLT
jgi:hypothetical protein